MTESSSGVVGFVGLGNMGRALAANLVGAGFDVVAYDIAGSRERAPDGATPVDTLTEVSKAAGVVVLSLPDATASREVTAALLEIPEPDRSVRDIVDTSTVGLPGARALAHQLAGRGIGYLDAPVSGGVAGARARTIAVMVAGPPETRTRLGPVLGGLSDRLYWVGDEAGMGQALKLANNFLSATAMAATSEAIAFGRQAGLDMATMLDVLNGSSGQNGATIDKFPNQVLTGRYASGFTNSLMAKDLDLYRAAVEESAGPLLIGSVTAGIWRRFADQEPGSDFTRIYPFVEGASSGEGASDR